MQQILKHIIEYQNKLTCGVEKKGFDRLMLCLPPLLVKACQL